MAEQQYVPFIRTEDAPLRPQPAREAGIWGWIWHNLLVSMTDFSSVAAAIRSLVMVVLTVVICWAGAQALWGLFSFAVLDATWSDPDGTKREACLASPGACWPYIFAKWKQVIYGRYPVDELWRVNLTYFLGAVGIGWLMIERLPWRPIVAGIMLLAFPLVAFVLLTGGNLEAGETFWTGGSVLAAVCLALGMLGNRGYGGEVLSAFSGFLMAVGMVLVYVLIATGAGTINWGLETENTETSRWGGLLVTLVVALTGIVASLPLGILLALGRRSRLPVVRLICVIFIEFWRGVPLITVLFMSSVMLPLFLPEGTDFNKLLRALIGVALFSAAYMAEVVRGGLQAIPTGQYEGSNALGLSYWKTMRLIILPQALVLVIPGIVNSFIALFKDTTLVLIIGLFDLLGSMQSSFTDASWSTPSTTSTGYLVVGLIFWVFCFGMSRYSMQMERKLRRGHAR